MRPLGQQQGGKNQHIHAKTVPPVRLLYGAGRQELWYGPQSFPPFVTIAVFPRGSSYSVPTNAIRRLGSITLFAGSLVAIEQLLTPSNTALHRTFRPVYVLPADPQD